MRQFVIIYCCVIIVLILYLILTLPEAYSQSLGLQMPSAPSVYGQDSIRAGDLDCKNAIGGATQVEFGVTGIVDNYDSPLSTDNGLNDDPSEKDVGVYARVIIPLDKPRERINCNTLYELELRKKRLEVMRLQEELDALKALNAKTEFEN